MFEDILPLRSRIGRRRQPFHFALIFSAINHSRHYMPPLVEAVLAYIYGFLMPAFAAAWRPARPARLPPERAGYTKGADRPPLPLSRASEPSVEPVRCRGGSD